MNKARRKALRDIIERISATSTELEQLRSDLETNRDEEQDYLDAMPDSLREGEKGSTAESAIEALQEAIDDLETTSDQINGIIEAIERAEGC